MVNGHFWGRFQTNSMGFHWKCPLSKTLNKYAKQITVESEQNPITKEASRGS